MSTRVWFRVRVSLVEGARMPHGALFSIFGFDVFLGLGAGLGLESGLGIGLGFEFRVTARDRMSSNGAAIGRERVCLPVQLNRHMHARVWYVS